METIIPEVLYYPKKRLKKIKLFMVLRNSLKELENKKEGDDKLRLEILIKIIDELEKYRFINVETFSEMLYNKGIYKLTLVTWAFESVMPFCSLVDQDETDPDFDAEILISTNQP